MLSQPVHSQSFRYFYTVSTFPPVVFAIIVIISLFQTGKGTDIKSVDKLRTAFISHSSIEMYINLYRDDGVPLSCHIHLNVLGSKHATNQLEPEKFAILTVRSASSFSHAISYNIGPGLLDNVSAEMRSEAFHKNIDV